MLQGNMEPITTIETNSDYNDDQISKSKISFNDYANNLEQTNREESGSPNRLVSCKYDSQSPLKLRDRFYSFADDQQVLEVKQTLSEDRNSRNL